MQDFANSARRASSYHVCQSGARAHQRTNCTFEARSSRTHGDGGSQADFVHGA